MVFRCYSDLAALPAGCEALFRQAECHSMFLTRPWLENLLAFSAAGETVVLAGVADGERLLALLPLRRQAGMLESLRHRYTALHSLLLAPEAGHEVLDCLATGLRGMATDGLLLEPVGAEEETMSRFQAALTRQGFVCDRSFRFYNWICPVTGCYGDYLAARPAQLRSTITRKGRKLQRERHGEFRILTGAGVPAGMADYHRVYRASWKAHEQYHAFLEGLVAAFSAAGWSRLGLLYVDGEPAAAQLWFVVGGKASIFRLAYDEKWRNYSPGTLLTARMMAHVIDVDGVAEIDFLTGNEGYKRMWMSQRRERQALACAPPPVRRRRLGRWFGRQPK